MKITKNTCSLIIALFTFLTLGACANQTAKTQRQSVEWKVESASQDEIDKSKSVVTAALKDPESARFGEKFWAIVGSNGRRSICGYVNAKNSFGGYTGKKLYIYTEKDPKFTILMEESGLGKYVLPDACSPRKT